MDVQRGTVSRVTDPGYLPRVARAIGAARTAGIPVVYVTVGFRHGKPEIHPRNKMFGALPSGAFTPDDPAAEIHPDVAPLPGETVVVKNRVSAFAGNDLRQILAAAGIDHLVLTGIATSGVVLATACHAADRDYRLTFLSDACADSDEDVHRILVERIFPRRGEVTTVADWAVSPEGS
jgi:nicotinamidase-related amidase